MSTGLEIRYLWHDIDVYKLCVSASSGAFSGGTELYTSLGALAEAASTLQGFPVDTSDIRKLQFGAFEREFAGFGVNLHFFCKDGAGHAVLEIRVESEDGCETNSKWNRPEQSAHFFAGVEPSAIDDFVAELRRLEAEKCGVASLRFVIF
ncbi:MAG: hypothetical protein ABSG62_01520 [Terracidiphilus sp.]